MRLNVQACVSSSNSINPGKENSQNLLKEKKINQMKHV